MTSSMKVELLWQRPAARWRERFSGTRLRARESVPPSSPGSCKEHAPRVTADLSRAWACPSTHSVPLGEGRSEDVLEAGLHPLEPERVPQALRNLGARSVGAVER